MALNLGEGDLRVALAVRKMPLASAGDIAAVQHRTYSGVRTRLRGLSDEEPWAMHGWWSRWPSAAPAAGLTGFP